MIDDYKKKNTRWLRGSRTFGYRIHTSSSAKKQGRTSVLAERADRLMVRLFEKGTSGDRLSAPPIPPGCRNEQCTRREQNEFASKTIIQRMSEVNRNIQKLKKELEELTDAPQLRRALVVPTLLIQIDTEEKKFSSMIKELQEESRIVEVSVGDASEFEPKSFKDMDPIEYAKLVDEQQMEYAED